MFTISFLTNSNAFCAFVMVYLISLQLFYPFVLLLNFLMIFYLLPGKTGF